jgi:hypothetical protein
MSNDSNSMKLTRWDSPTDKFNYQQLAENFRIIAEHNHDPEGAGGVQIGNGGIANGAIDNGKLSIDAVNTDNILTGAVTEGKIDSGFVSKAVPSYLETAASLPSSPIDGQEIYYEADSANSAIWHLRYASSKNKWEYLGGTSKTDTTYAASSKTVSSTSTYSGTGTASVTTPNFTGTCAYIVDIFAEFGSSADTHEVFISFKNGSNTAIDSNGFAQYVVASGSGGVMSGYKSAIVTGVSGATTFLTQVRSSQNATITLYRHTISVRPIFVI